MDVEEAINARAEEVVQGIVGLIEQESKGPDDVLRAAVGVLVGRTAKLEAVIEHMSALLRDHANMVLLLTVQVKTLTQQMEGLLNEELRQSRSGHQH